MPLKDCVEQVKRYYNKTFIEMGQKKLEKAKEYLEKKEYGMYGFCLKCVGKIFSQDFSDGCHIYNIEEHNYSIPKDEELEEYYAVMIDLHS